MSIDSSLPYISIYDTTLREGEQSPVTLVTKQGKVQVIRILDELGVDVIEAGFPRAQPSDVQVFREAKEIVTSSKIAGFARAVKTDIDLVAEGKADIVQIFIPGSDPQLKAMMNVSWDNAIDRLVSAIRHAISKDLKVYVAITDIPRARKDVLQKIFRTIIRENVDEAVLADTLGIALPVEIQEIVKYALETGVERVGLHLHNDLGLATCNALAGIYSGAREIQVTIGGVGERLGNTPLEELGAIARVKKIFRTGLKYEKLIPSIRKALEILGVKPHPLKPVIGEHAFLHATDIHVYSYFNVPESFNPFNPKILGGKITLAYGKLTGAKAVKASLESLGITVSDEDAREIASIIKGKSKRVLEYGLEDLRRIAMEYFEKKEG